MNHILALIHVYACLYSVDPKLVYSVVKVESGFNASLIGRRGEVGLMQVTPSTAKMSPNALLDPETNIREGVRYLASMRDECRLQANYEWVICFNRGPHGSNKVRKPEQDKYYKKVMKEYSNAQDSAL